MKVLLLYVVSLSLLLVLRSQAQCTTALVVAQACTVPSGATVITDAGGGNSNVSISSGTYVYGGSSGISSLNMSGGTLYYTSSATLNNTNFSGGTLVYSGTGSASINQAGGTLQVCGSGQLTLTGNFNGGALVVAMGGKLTVPNGFTLQNSSQLTNYGTLIFQGSLSVASSSAGLFVNVGALTASGQVFLNGPGFVNQGTANFGTLVVNGSGAACLSPGSTLNVTTFQSNDNTNSFTVSPTTGKQACIKIASYGNFNSLLATALPSKLGICRVGTASAAELAKYGTATVTQNCTSCQTVLPVVLTSFTATAAAPGGPVALRWRTASEVDHAGFVVERSLDDRVFADQSALVPATGGLQGASYAWADADPLPGQRYYRLRLLATDGSPAMWSPTVAVLVAASTDAWAWAYSPDADHLRLDWLAPAGLAAPALQVAVVDIQGRRCQQYSLAAPAAGGATLALAGLAPGAYWLRLEQGGRRQLLRFARP